MSLRKSTFIICLIISTLCLAAGFGIAGQWIGAAIAMIIGLAWMFAPKYPALSVMCLLAFVCLAVVGRLNGSPPMLMICGSGIALAVWDLGFLNDAISNSTDEQSKRYETKHLQSLFLALGSGLLLAFLGRLLSLRLSFVILMLLVVLTLYGLDRVLGVIKKRSMRISE